QHPPECPDQAADKEDKKMTEREDDAETGEQPADGLHASPTPRTSRQRHAQYAAEQPNHDHDGNQGKREREPPTGFFHGAQQDDHRYETGNRKPQKRQPNPHESKPGDDAKNAPARIAAREVWSNSLARRPQQQHEARTHDDQAGKKGEQTALGTGRADQAERPRIGCRGSPEQNPECVERALEHGRGPKRGGPRGRAHGATRRGATPGTSVLPRSQQLRRVPHYRLPSMLEYRERLGDFGNRLFRALRIDDDDVSRAADGKAVVGQVEQPRRA